jgi:5'-3' exonuclease
MSLNIYINNKKPLVLIDGSYFIFNRFYSTYKWYSYQEKDIDTDSEDFINSFIKHVDSDFNKIMKKIKTDMNSIILCMDCSRCDIWRNDLYDKYKASRLPKTNFNPKIFDIFNNHIKKIKIQQIYFDRLEADDIVYLMHKKVKYINPKQSFVVITNDNDYLQITDKYTKIINMQFKDIRLRGTLNYEVDLLVKIIYGDKGDNIPKIMYGITKEKAIKIAVMTEEDREKFLLENNIKDNYELNKKLISFDSIPNFISKNFYEYYNIIII